MTPEQHARAKEFAEALEKNADGQYYIGEKARRLISRDVQEISIMVMEQNIARKKAELAVDERLLEELKAVRPGEDPMRLLAPHCYRPEGKK